MRRAGHVHPRPSLPRPQGAAHHERRVPTSARCASAARCWRISRAPRDASASDVTALAGTCSGRALIGEALLDEVTALVEWPVAARRALRGALPRAAARGADLHARRITSATSRSRTPAAPAAGVHHRQQHREPRSGQGARGQRARGAPAAGRCRVLLGTGPQAVPLAARLGALDAVTFQAKLGSLGDKTRRVIALATDIAAAANGAGR